MSLFRELSQDVAVFPIGPGQRRPERCQSLGIRDRHDFQARAILGCDLERSLRRDAQQIQDRPVDYQCITVAVFRERLNHRTTWKLIHCYYIVLPMPTGATPIPELTVCSA